MNVANTNLLVEHSWNRPNNVGRQREYNAERSSNVPMAITTSERDMAAVSAYGGSGSHRREVMDDAPASVSLSGSGMSTIELMTVEEQQ